jgi:hypothetical protein
MGYLMVRGLTNIMEDHRSNAGTQEQGHRFKRKIEKFLLISIRPRRDVPSTSFLASFDDVLE